MPKEHDDRTGTKYCPKCDTTKPKTDFNKKRSRPDGLQSNCRSCNKSYYQEYYNANRGHLKATSRAWKAANPRRCRETTRRYRKAYPFRTAASSMMAHVRRQSKKLGIPFEITAEWLTERIRPMICEATGVQLEFGEGKWGPLSPSIDQIIPGAGYTKDNVQITALAYNAGKRDWGEDYILMMADGIRARRASLRSSPESSGHGE